MLRMMMASARNGKGGFCGDEECMYGQNFPDYPFGYSASIRAFILA